MEVLKRALAALVLLSVFSSCFYVFADAGNKGENEKCKRISLTFDDGRMKTAEILNELCAKYDAKASLMMITKNVLTQLLFMMIFYIVFPDMDTHKKK